MLNLLHICKEYKTAGFTQKALNDVSLTLRDNEFVAILGPSGSGKTTLLNIIGGLDRYDSGDLIINDVSTREYKDRDWDSYRNHSIGFVFQNYNLIPHQSVLANVELALTISGIRRSDRRERARQALIKVGLEDHLHKKPNQLSGGQMQRVAIARALVNNPKILLADEPTGALDTETSVQVMELLKEVAQDRLVVMVTHNPELAEAYATRIVKLQDGKITDDSDPVPQNEENKAQHRNFGRASMSFLASLNLSFNNLLTKKARAILTSFAGSIGIIGIALILAISTGVNNWINDIQKDTMTSYPITIDAQTIDLSRIFEAGQKSATDHTADHDNDAVYSNTAGFELASVASGSLTKNNLTKFKEYLNDPDSEIHQYLGENGVVYTYSTKFSLYNHDSDGFLVNTDGSTLSKDQSLTGAVVGGMSQMLSGGSSTASGGSVQMGSINMARSDISQMLPNREGRDISPAILENYKVLAGDWPQSYDEVVLVVDQNNEISAAKLYQLGLLPTAEYRALIEKIEAQEELNLESVRFDYNELLGETFQLLCACDLYEEGENGLWANVSTNPARVEELLRDTAVELKIVGVVRADGDQSFISTPLAYTQSLTDYLIDHTAESAVVQAQMDRPNVNILTGMAFEPESDEEKIANTIAHLSALSVSEKAKFFDELMALAQMSGQTVPGEGMPSEGMPEDAIADSIPEGMGKAGQLSKGVSPDALPEEMNPDAMSGNTAVSAEVQKAAMLDAYLADPKEEELLLIYQNKLSPGKFENNLSLFGVVDRDAPASISLYADSFEDKDLIAGCISRYNESVDEIDQITYTDFVGLIMSSMTNIIDVISYVLIAFVSVSLVVSSIMIGIITYISVLERTKEIGILRAIGASKRNISQVFNAETFIIGLLSGLLGVGVTLLFLLPINAIIHAVTDVTTFVAKLPAGAALVLIALSMILTIISGLFPASKAAKRDPVTALRSE